MSGYIDENARIADDIHNAYEEGYADGKRDAVVHGHWIQEGEPPMFSLTCSVCGQKFFNHYLQPHANYCSMCGAKMDEVT